MKTIQIRNLQLLSLVLSLVVSAPMLFLALLWSVARRVKQYVLGLALLGAASLGWATSPYDTLTAAVTFTDAGTAILAVLAIVIGFVILVGGGMMVVNLVRRNNKKV